jgi:hypothetical protein
LYDKFSDSEKYCKGKVEIAKMTNIENHTSGDAPNNINVVEY